MAHIHLPSPPPEAFRTMNAVIPRAPSSSVVASAGLALAVAWLLAWLLVETVYGLYLSPLRHIPGSTLARFSRLWELWAFGRGNFHEKLIRLHKRHGPVVRLAPNRFSFNRSDDMKKIYAASHPFVKTTFYHSWSDPSCENMLSLRDEAEHSKRKRVIAQLYSMAAVAGYEHAVDRIKGIFVKTLDARVESGEDMELPAFCQLYAFDVIGDITMETSFGMMQGCGGGDKMGLLRLVSAFANYSVHMGLFPEFHVPVFTLLRLTGLPAAQNLVLAMKTAIQRFRNAAASPDAAPEHSQSFLAKLLSLEAQGRVSVSSMMDVMSANINAGSDTTAVAISAALYYLYTNPTKLKVLRTEIDAHVRDGRASDPVSFAQAQAMPYLQAVIKEVLRMHPAVGPILPRAVPEGGVQLGGHFFPAKTTVGCSAWPLHYNPDEFDEPRTFLPERWLSDEDGKPPGANFAFGAGPRMCFGKNISLLEMCKLLPQIVRRFDLQIREAPGHRMQTQGVWFIWPRYTCRVQQRPKIE